MMLNVFAIALLLGLSSVSAFSVGRSALVARNSLKVSSTRPTALFASDASKEPEDLEETTKKYGLEVGLYKAMTTKSEEGEQKVKPQDLLKKYGIAYLATSITLAIISYAICYILVSTGVDVSSMLEKIGIQATATSANAGTAAIAYAIHKALSPVRFPPTVALTPVVANLIGKKPDGESSEESAAK
jgi:hypothetical protein